MPAYHGLPPCLDDNGNGIPNEEDGDGLISRPETITFDISEMGCVPLVVGMSGDTARTIPLEAVWFVYVSVGVAVLLIMGTVRFKR